MKRIYKVMACTMLAVALTGCKNKTAPSNGDDSVISLTKEDNIKRKICNKLYYSRS